MRAALSKAQFTSEFSGRFGTALQPRSRANNEVIPTGIVEVDTLIGGLPRGAITEIFGVSSSGRTALMLATLAEASQRDEVCAVVDTTDAFDPKAAALAGANLHRVLWLRCGSILEHAFKVTDMLLQGRGFGLVLLDLADVPGEESRRIISSWWYRFRRVVEDTPTVFVVIAQDSCVRSCASLSLQTTCESDSWRRTAQTTISSVLLPRGSGGSPPTSVVEPPTHALLFKGLRLQLHRQKPVNLSNQQVKFVARIPQSQLSFTP